MHLHFLLALTGALVGQGCCTPYFCLQSLLLILIQFSSSEALACTAWYY